MNRVFLGYGIGLSPNGIDKEVIDEINNSIPYYFGPIDGYNDINWFFGKIIEDVDEGSFKALSGMVNSRNRVTEEDIKYLDEKMRELSSHSCGYTHYGYYLIYAVSN